MNSAMEMGIPLSEIKRMLWGRLVMMLQARASSFEEDEPEQATFEQMAAFFGR